jgi:glycosyltransferase involved in cell wall biosynthesis
MVKTTQVKTKPSISVFFPCYNDAGSIGLLVRDAKEILEEISTNFEIIVVDDGSVDESRKLLKRLSLEIPKLKLIFHKKNMGYGGALKSGFAHARFEWVFYTDGDGQYDVKDIRKFASKVSDNLDVIQGYKISRADPWYRTLIGRVYHNFAKLSFSLKIRDVDCDFRLIRKKAIDSIELENNSGVICVELVKKLQDKGFRFAEVGVNHYPRLYGHSQFFNYKRIAKTLLELIILWFNLVLLKSK